MKEQDIDSQLVRLSEGDERAYEALYDRLGPALYRTALSLLGCPGYAEDAVQDVFVALYRSRKCLPAVCNIKAYLFASLRRAAATISASRAASAGRRSGLRRQDPAFRGPPTASGPDAADDPLARALAALPCDQREVITLKIEGGLTFAEIAVATGVSPNTAASRYRYALQRLRARLGGPSPKATPKPTEMTPDTLRGSSTHTSGAAPATGPAGTSPGTKNHTVGVDSRGRLEP